MAKRTACSAYRPARSARPVSSASKARQAALNRARMAAMRRRAQEIEDEIEDEDEDEEEQIEEARRCAARRSAIRRAALRRKAQEETVVKKDDEQADEKKDEEDNVPPADIEPSEDEQKEEACRAARRAAARRAMKRRASMRRRAEEGSDDLTGPDGDSANIEELKKPDSPSDDLVETDEEKGGVQQTPPASVNEAESKVIAAYNLIDKQIAQKVVRSDVRKASLAGEYCKKYTAREMKFAAEQLSMVGSAGKASTEGVRVAKRSSLPAASKPVSTKNDGMDNLCLFC